MRSPHATLLLIALAASPLRAQSVWRHEVGLEGGFIRVKPAGTGATDHTDLVDLPAQGGDFGSFFLIIPLARRLAIEPSLAFAQLSAGDPRLFFVSSTSVNLGVRLDVALTSRFYVAAGPTLRYAEQGGTHDTQFGLQAAIGTRVPVAPLLTARLEGRVMTRAKGTNEIFEPANVYTVLVGVSAAARHAGEEQPPGRERPWRWALGLAGGYTRAHVRGSVPGLGVDLTADQTLWALPGSGATTPPTLFALIPLGGRFALEPGLDAHRSQSGGVTTFGAHVSTRINYAFHQRWYAGTGINALYSQETDQKGFAFAGMSVAAGYRFALTQALGGRVEVNYTMFKERSNFALATNTLGLMFGILLPLD